jgi:hypothetical protein
LDIYHTGTYSDRYLKADAENKLFLIRGLDGHNDYHVRYSNQELVRYGRANNFQKLTSEHVDFSRKIQQACWPTLSAKTDQIHCAVFMHTFLIRPNEMEIFPELGLKTKTVQILPREVIVNRTKRKIALKQKGNNIYPTDILLGPNERKVLYWPMRDVNGITSWIIDFPEKSQEDLPSSPSLRVTKLQDREFQLVCQRNINVIRFFKKSIKKMNEIIYITIEELSEPSVGIQIQNLTDITFTTRQRALPAELKTRPSGEARGKRTTPFAWTSPDTRNVVQFRIENWLNPDYSDHFFDIDFRNSEIYNTENYVPIMPPGPEQ